MNEPKNNPPFTNPAPPPHVPVDHGSELRASMIVWAGYCIRHRDKFTYSQGPARWRMVQSAPGLLPQTADCSSFVTGLAKWAGAGDPNGLDFQYGYTGTLLKHCNLVTTATARMGDLIVYGPGTGSHAVLIMERLPGADFWVASHGHQGDPSRIRHSGLLSYFNGSARYLRWLS